MGFLRFILAISVIVFHTGDLWGIKLVEGQVAVQAFYMISGFYMALILNKKYPSGIKGYYLFLSNRFLKIFPTYWFVLFVTIVVLFVAHKLNHAPWHFGVYIEYGDILAIETWLAILFANLFIIGQDILLFTKLNTSGALLFSDQLWQNIPHVFDFIAIPQAWSVSCELMFYLIAPFTIRKPILVFAITLASFILRYLFIMKGMSTDPWTYRFFPFELQFFYMGAISFFFYERFIAPLTAKQSILSFLFLSITTAFTFTYTFLPNNMYVLPSKFLVFNNSFFVFPFKFWIYMTLLLFAVPNMFGLTQNNKWDKHLGDLSYPMYISHMFFIFLLEAFQIIDKTNPLRTLSICLATTVFSYFLNAAIIIPIESLRQERIKTKLQ